MKNNKNFALKALLFTTVIGAGTMLYKKFIKESNTNIPEDSLQDNSCKSNTTSDCSFEIKLNSSNENDFHENNNEEIINLEES